MNLRLPTHLILCLFAALTLAAYSVYGGGHSRSALLFLDTFGSKDLQPWGQWTESFVKTPDAPTIAIFQRWSLSESIDSQSNRLARYPMQESESELFRALATFVPTLPRDRVIITDGCAGDFSKTHLDIRNGWTYNALAENLNKPDFSFIPTFLPWKLELILEKPQQIVCGEDPRLLELQNSIFDRLRVEIGTLRQNPRAALQSLSARQATTLHFKSDLAQFDSTLAARAVNFVKVLQRFANRDLVLISHSAVNRHIVQGLRTARMNFSIFETLDYRPFAADSSILLHSYLQSIENPSALK